MDTYCIVKTAAESSHHATKITSRHKFYKKNLITVLLPSWLPILELVFTSDKNIMSLSKSIWHETSGRMLSAFPPHPIFTAFLGAVYNSPYPPPTLKN